MKKLTDPEGAPPPLKPLERFVEALEVAAMFGPLPGIERPPWDGLSPPVKVHLDALRQTHSTNRKGKYAVPITRAALEQALDRHREYSTMNGKSPLKGWRTTVATQLTAWKYIKPRLPEIGMTVADIEDYLSK